MDADRAASIAAPGGSASAAALAGVRARIAALPRVPLGRYPTPIERAGALSRRAGREVWVKRDDLSAERYGGNKVRKLELLLGDLRARGRHRLVTTGTWGSHHVLATALYAREQGIEVEAVLFPQPLTPEVRDAAARIAALASRLFPVRHPLLIPPVLSWRRLAGVVPVAPGGSSALGAIGFVAAAIELADQVRAGEAPEPREVYLALGTTGTAAGLALGLALCGVRSRVVGVRITSPAVANAAVARRLARAAARRLGVAPPRVRLDVDARQLGRGYGHATPAAADAVALAAEDGLALETTYTGKALAALLAGAGNGPALFWNTFNSRPLGPPPGPAPAWLPG